VKAIVEHIVTQLTPYYGEHEARELAFWIIEETTGMSRFDLCTHKGTKNIPDLEIILKKLCNFVPVQYIFGHTEWLGLDLEVNEATLIPRPETAELISLIDNHTPYTVHHTPYTILDIGTGSGCIALALKKKHPEWIVEGLDKSEEVITVAKRNAKKLGLDVRFFVADILSNEIGEYNIIVSNPPYIRPSERGTMTENTLRYEPKEALFVPEEDPLLFYRRIAQLHKAKELWFEISETQSDAMLELMQQTDYEAECLKDMYGKQRFIHAIQK
jgi:release factor glutamine methyltransferase